MTIERKPLPLPESIALLDVVRWHVDMARTHIMDADSLAPQLFVASMPVRESLCDAAGGLNVMKKIARELINAHEA